ncbi:hypothetical protein DL93DRAFT_1657250 [Clavulina sp. PMI_390]|nr:hypothetical protein DL93DRAFT_1657250 [Clavulina sp. PMI_390]
MSSKETDEEEAIGHDSSISAPSKLNKGKQKEGAPPTKKQRAPAASKPNKAPENSGEESASDQPAPALPAKSTKVSKTSEAAVRRKKAAAAGKSAEVPENEESETADASKLMVRESIDDLMTNTAVVEPAQSPQSCKSLSTFSPSMDTNNLRQRIQHSTKGDRSRQGSEGSSAGFCTSSDQGCTQASICAWLGNIS